MNNTELVLSILPFIYKKANKYSHCPDVVDELVQEGVIGAYKALETWDESKGKFITYADDAIRWAMCRWFKSQQYKGYAILANAAECDVDDIPQHANSAYDDYLAHELDEAIKELAPKIQLNIQLIIEHGGASNAAKHLGISTQAMCIRQKWAISKLRERFA